MPSAEENLALIKQLGAQLLAAISDTAYAASWDAVTTIAPSKNAVYDKIETLGNCSILLDTYTGNGVGNAANWLAIQSITLGFRPKYVSIQPVLATAVETTVWEVRDIGSAIALVHVGGGTHLTLDYGLRITATGFDVGDRNIDSHPNKNGVVYAYYVLY